MIYIDTNIFIYLFELHDPFSNQVASMLEKFKSEGKHLVTSTITITEFLSGTISSNLQTLQQVPNLIIISLDERLAEQAATLQRKHKIQIGDSIHLATAVQQKAESFFTNDIQLANVVEKYTSVINL
jgi:predicted nucleic acid-binding protein